MRPGAEERTACRSRQVVVVVRPERSGEDAGGPRHRPTAAVEPQGEAVALARRALERVRLRAAEVAQPVQQPPAVRVAGRPRPPSAPVVPAQQAQMSPTLPVPRQP